MVYGILALGPYKVPRPDGLHPIFFQKLWETLKDSLLKVCQDALILKRIPPGLGDSLIALTPKGQQPSNLNNFKPISLCNMLFKGITRILMDRLRPALDSLITPHQCSFFFFYK